MKQIMKFLKAFGLLIRLLIDLTGGLVLTFMVVVVVYPISFCWQRIRAAYFELKKDWMNY